jgi:hypothetical protein
MDHIDYFLEADFSNTLEFYHFLNTVNLDSNLAPIECTTMFENFLSDLDIIPPMITYPELDSCSHSNPIPEPEDSPDPKDLDRIDYYLFLLKR